MIAVTDHHAASGIDDVRAAARHENIAVLPGMELTCRIGDVDEVFLLSLFPEDFAVAAMERLLDAWDVPAGERGSGGFVVPRPVPEIVAAVRDRGGVIVSARADKTRYRRKAIPALIEAGVRMFDLVHPASRDEVFPPACGPLCFFTFSDAHSPDDTGSRFSSVELPRPSFAALLELTGEKI